MSNAVGKQRQRMKGGEQKGGAKTKKQTKKHMEESRVSERTKPRHPIAFFYFLLTSVTSPKLLKYCRSLESSVAQLSPPTKTCGSVETKENEMSERKKEHEGGKRERALDASTAAKKSRRRKRRRRRRRHALFFLLLYLGGPRRRHGVATGLS